MLDPEPEHASRWAAIVSIAGKIGCTAQTLNKWVKKAERNSGEPGLTSDMAASLEALEREKWKLRQPNEVMRKASGYFAQAELDCRHEP